MAYAGSRDLNDRLARIEERNRLLTEGAVLEIRKDGLVVARPQPRKARRRPWRLIFLVLVTALAFKSFVYADLGVERYEARMERLAQGTVIERGAAWLMKADPVTVWAATRLRMALR